MASLDKHYKANGARLSQLLIDKGTEAMRNVFDAIHPPSNLTAVLASRKSFLVKLRCINPSQREILFPSSGTPSTSKDFDITLLYILLRNICGLRPPVSTGSWVNNPPSTDTSTEANVARIKYYRNAVYGHITTTGIDDVNFQSHWNNISTALISLGISHGDIESLRYTPLEEDVYVNSIRKLESVMLNRLDGVESLVKQRVDILEEAVKKEVNDGVLGSNDKNIQSQQNIIDKLSKCNVKGDIVKLTKKFHKGSRKWLLDKVDNWFTDQESDSKVMILTAGPGVGKSVFAAKVCQVYQEKGLLAAGHFCKFNYTDLRNPKSMLESLSSHMCDNVPGFKEKLVDQLRRHHSMDTITDTFRVLLNDPLHALNEREPMMIVIDGLDESETNGKSELLDLLAKDFPDLPGCVKIFITSRPELPVREKLAYLNPVEIKPGDVNNDQDLNDFLGKHLSEVKLEKNAVTRLVKKCQGSFLFANHVVLYLTRQIKNESSMVVDVEGCVPTSISSVYQEYFDRLKKELAPLFLGKTEHFFQNILEILTAARGPLPLSVVAEVLELPADTHQMKEVIRKMNERLSALLDIDDDCLTVFHKSVVDWLLSEGYDDHPYTVDETSGHRHLWLACRKKLETENTSTEQSRRQEKGDEYAKRHGIDHLEWLTTLGLHESWKIPDCTPLKPIYDIVNMKLRERYWVDGRGWIFHQDNENVYLMTTKCATNPIQCKFGESVPTVHIESTRSCKVDSKLGGSVVVSSDEGSLLNYAVIKCRSTSIASKFPLRKPLAIGKPCLTAGSPIELNEDRGMLLRVLPYPNYLVDLLKEKTGRFNVFSRYNGRHADMRCDHGFWDEVERNKDIFLFNNIKSFDERNSQGFPLCNSDVEVVGMFNSTVYINGPLRRHCMIGIAVRIDKIIKDIYRKTPDLAKNIFPDFHDTY